MIKNIILRKLLPKYHAKKIGVEFGRDCNFINVSWGSEPYMIALGNNVTLSNVSFNTHDGSCRIIRDKFPNIDLIEPISIGSNVFIGTNTIILPGVTIKDNIIVGAGSVVTKKMYEGDSVYAGNPARKICTLAEWTRKNEKRFERTKGMTFEEKKKFYREKYRDSRVTE